MLNEVVVNMTFSDPFTFEILSRFAPLQIGKLPIIAGKTTATNRNDHCRLTL